MTPCHDSQRLTAPAFPLPTAPYSWVSRLRNRDNSVNYACVGIPAGAGHVLHGDVGDEVAATNAPGTPGWVSPSSAHGWWLARVSALAPRIFDKMKRQSVSAVAPC